MAVYLGSKKYGQGEGPSKQKAEEAAAERALQKVISS
jgi:dsRNA-specific ribonuclease